MHEYLTETSEAVALCVGPEGGFAQDEVDFLIAARFSPIEARRRSPPGRNGRALRGRSRPDHPVGALVMDSQAPLNRISILGVPVDILPEEGIEDLVARFADGKNHQIILLSLWDLMRARRSGEFRTMVSGASLVLPISHSIVKGARFLRRAEPVRYMPFDFVVKLLAALEQRGKSVYLLGRHEDQRPEGGVQHQVDLPGAARSRALRRAPIPSRWKVPSSRPVKKATPSLLLVGSGVPGREKWIPRNLARFNSGHLSLVLGSFRSLCRKGDPSLRRLCLSVASSGCPIYGASLGSFIACFIYIWYNVLLLVARLRRA